MKCLTTEAMLRLLDLLDTEVLVSYPVVIVISKFPAVYVFRDGLFCFSGIAL